MRHQGRVLRSPVIHINAIHRFQVFDRQRSFAVESELAMFSADRIVIDTDIGAGVTPNAGRGSKLPFLLLHTIHVILEYQFVEHDARRELDEKLKRRVRRLLAALDKLLFVCSTIITRSVMATFFGDHHGGA